MSKEAMKLALEAMKTVFWHGGGSCWIVDAEKLEDAEKALEEALAKQEQGEPLCTAAMFDDAFLAKSGLSPDTKLYTTPQQRKPLTDEQMEKKYREEMRSRNWEAYDVWLLKQQKTLSDNKIMEIRKSMGPVVNFIAFARAIEAAHGIKE
jgi:hypothetical protein